MSWNHHLKWYLSRSWSKHRNHLQQEPWCWFRQVQQLLLCHCCGWRDSLWWDSWDSLNLTIAEPRPSMILNVCGNVRCVVVTVSGRPVLIEPYESQIDALVAAWVPGTEGQGVANVLFGDYGFTGKLPRTWFKTVDQLPMNVGDSHYNPLFPYDFGLPTKPVNAS